jgi:DTW domain-containing protein YfiP
MRETCYRCFWPRPLCWCGSITPMATRTRFVFLMHPKEFKQEKAATGRLTHLCLAESEIQMGIGFEDHEAVQALIRDPSHLPVLLYPGRDALNLTTARATADDVRFATLQAELRQRRLVVFLLDATWALGRKMLRLSPSLQRLPRIMFTPTAPSRYVIRHAGVPIALRRGSRPAGLPAPGVQTGGRTQRFPRTQRQPPRQRLSGSRNSVRFFSSRLPAVDVIDEG